ncbi:MAG: orotate phosphoribosyltransferase [Bacteroidota bacterium]|nr:orotate phosphoribosyltransferase [Bacteroidota bacterium]
MNNKNAVAEKLLQINAIKLSVNAPFTWASGWKSPIYCDNRRILSFPAERDFIRDEMCTLIDGTFDDIDLIAGVATAGIPWGALAADRLMLPFIYVRPKPKEHGLGNQIEGFYEAGKRVVIVEDLISTGKSSLQVADVLKKAGLNILGMVSIFNYGFEIARSSFKDKDVRYHSLTDYETLISEAIKKDIISVEDQKSLLKWSENPSNWKPSS